MKPITTAESGQADLKAWMDSVTPQHQLHAIRYALLGGGTSMLGRPMQTFPRHPHAMHVRGLYPKLANVRFALAVYGASKVPPLLIIEYSEKLQPLCSYRVSAA